MVEVYLGRPVIREFHRGTPSDICDRLLSLIEEEASIYRMVNEAVYDGLATVLGEKPNKNIRRHLGKGHKEPEKTPDKSQKAECVSPDLLEKFAAEAATRVKKALPGLSKSDRGKVTAAVRSVLKDMING